LKHFASQYERANLDTKQKLIGSIFPKKFVFENNEYRTQKMMRVVYKIRSKIDAFRAKKMGLMLISQLSPIFVIPLGLEPRTPTLKVLCSTN
jgi:site-specific DNA recombinase